MAKTLSHSGNSLYHAPTICSLLCSLFQTRSMMKAKNSYKMATLWNYGCQYWRPIPISTIPLSLKMPIISIGKTSHLIKISLYNTASQLYHRKMPLLRSLQTPTNSSPWNDQFSKIHQKRKFSSKLMKSSILAWTHLMAKPRTIKKQENTD